MNKVYCVCCGEKVPYDIHFSDEKFTIRGIEVECMTEKAVCRQCGGEVYDPEVNDINYKLRLEAFLRAKEDA